MGTDQKRKSLVILQTGSFYGFKVEDPYSYRIVMIEDSHKNQHVRFIFPEDEKKFEDEYSQIDQIFFHPQIRPIPIYKKHKKKTESEKEDDKDKQHKEEKTLEQLFEEGKYTQDFTSYFKLIFTTMLEDRIIKGYLNTIKDEIIMVYEERERER